MKINRIITYILVCFLTSRIRNILVPVKGDDVLGSESLVSSETSTEEEDATVGNSSPAFGISHNGGLGLPGDASSTASLSQEVHLGKVDDSFSEGLTYGAANQPVDPATQLKLFKDDSNNNPVEIKETDFFQDRYLGHLTYVFKKNVKCTLVKFKDKDVWKKGDEEVDEPRSVTYDSVLGEVAVRDAKSSVHFGMDSETRQWKHVVTIPRSKTIMDLKTPETLPKSHYTASTDTPESHEASEEAEEGSTVASGEGGTDSKQPESSQQPDQDCATVVTSPQQTSTSPDKSSSKHGDGSSTNVSEASQPESGSTHTSGTGQVLLSSIYPTGAASSYDWDTDSHGSSGSSNDTNEADGSSKSSGEPSESSSAPIKNNQQSSSTSADSSSTQTKKTPDGSGSASTDQSDSTPPSVPSGRSASGQGARTGQSSTSTLTVPAGQTSTQAPKTGSQQVSSGQGGGAGADGSVASPPPADGGSGTQTSYGEGSGTSDDGTGKGSGEGTQKTDPDGTSATPPANPNEAKKSTNPTEADGSSATPLHSSGGDSSTLGQDGSSATPLHSSGGDSGTPGQGATATPPASSGGDGTTAKIGQDASATSPTAGSTDSGTKTGVELSLKATAATDELDYNKDGQVVTYTAKDKYSFKSVKTGKKGDIVVWSTDKPSEYATKVVLDGKGKKEKIVTIHMSNNSTISFKKDGKNKPWNEYTGPLPSTGQSGGSSATPTDNTNEKTDTVDIKKPFGEGYHSTKINFILTYEPDSGYSFKAVKEDSKDIWNTDKKDEYSKKVKADFGKNVVTVYIGTDGKSTKVYKKGSDGNWKEDTQASTKKSSTDGSGGGGTQASPTSGGGKTGTDGSGGTDQSGGGTTGTGGGGTQQSTPATQ